MMIDIRKETPLIDIIRDIKKVLKKSKKILVFDFGCHWESRTWYARILNNDGSVFHEQNSSYGMREPIVSVHNYLKISELV